MYLLVGKMQLTSQFVSKLQILPCVEKHKHNLVKSSLVALVRIAAYGIGMGKADNLVCISSIKLKMVYESLKHSK